MALSGNSLFYYGYTITSLNQNLNFDEGTGELLAQISIGSYTATELADAVKTAMDAVGQNVYTVTFNRASRTFTITTDQAFDLLTNTGSQFGTSIFSLLGFNLTLDVTAQLSYESQGPSGDFYLTQFPPQSYVEPGEFVEKIEPTVNETASGQIESITFGDRLFTRFTLNFITNRAVGGGPIRQNLTGVDDAKRFLRFCITKAPLEFMPNSNNTGEFFKVILSDSGVGRDGTGFLLQEKTAENLPGYYDTSLLTFRVF